MEEEWWRKALDEIIMEQLVKDVKENNYVSVKKSLVDTKSECRAVSNESWYCGVMVILIIDSSSTPAEQRTIGGNSSVVYRDDISASFQVICMWATSALSSSNHLVF